MKNNIRICIAQLNCTVGDLDGNGVNDIIADSCGFLMENIGKQIIFYLMFFCKGPIRRDCKGVELILKKKFREEKEI